MLPLGREALQKIGSFYWLRVLEMRQFGGELTPRPLRDMGISRFGLREMLQEPAARVLDNRLERSRSSKR